MIKMQRIIFNMDPLEVCVENVNHWVRAYFYLIMLKNADTFHPKVIYIYKTLNLSYISIINKY